MNLSFFINMRLRRFNIKLRKLSNIIPKYIEFVKFRYFKVKIKMI